MTNPNVKIQIDGSRVIWDCPSSQVHCLFLENSERPTDWADVLVVADQHYFILDGRNCGTKTAKIVFPDLASVKVYLAGKWRCAQGYIKEWEK